jgi:zeaxanthin glucosyltransferase
MWSRSGHDAARAMSHVGLFCFLGRGHLDPALALGRRLVSQGHGVTVFHLTIAEAAIRTSGLQFAALDRLEPLPGASAGPTKPRWPKYLDTLDAVTAQAHRVLREAPAAVSAAGVDALIGDQSDLAAGTVAEHLRLPFLTLACAPPLPIDPVVPTPFFDWYPATTPRTRLRNRLGNAFVERAVAPVLGSINRQRRQWGLPALRHFNDTFSRRGIVAQIPAVLDFSERRPSPPIFYAGPLRDDRGPRIRFPWNRLDGRPLVFGSMGTVRNNMPWVFRTMAEACAALDVQLVLSLGGGTLCPEDLGPLPGDPIVVHYAPQRELLRRASLAVTCAGLNTTLDAVGHGVPMVAVPVAEDQPGVGARIRRAGVGLVLPLRRLSAPVLRAAVQTVLTDAAYRASARALQRELAAIDGTAVAAGLVERLLDLRVAAPAGLVQSR